MLAIFPNVCLWRRSYSQNWEVLTFICQYGLRYCIVSPSFLLYRFVKIWATWENFLGKWFTAPPPPGKKLPVRLCLDKLFPILPDKGEDAIDMSVKRAIKAWRWDFVQRKANEPKSLSFKKRSSNCKATLTFTWESKLFYNLKALISLKWSLS